MDLPGWMTFPTLVEAFQPTPAKAIAALREKQREYESTGKSAGAAEKVKARLVAASYRRTCDLLEELEADRLRINKTADNVSAPPKGRHHE
jgi:hypothetical protein